MEVDVEEVEKIDFVFLMKKLLVFVFRVMSNDFVDDFIVEGDMLIFCFVIGEEEIEDGELVVVSIKGGKIVIKCYY